MSSIEKVEHYQVVKNISSYSKNGMQMAESLSTQPEVQKVGQVIKKTLQELWCSKEIKAEIHCHHLTGLGRIKFLSPDFDVA